jgi:hypothetical protein
VTTTAPSDRPEFFIDKSLGAKKLRAALEVRGYVAHTINQEYGVDVKVPDPTWIHDAGGRGWLILTKDDIRVPEAQLRDMEEVGAKVFWLADGGLKANVFVPRYMKHLDGIIKRGKRQGPYMYKVDEDALRLVQLQPPKPVKTGEQGILVTDG